jgi:hypothetical protein
VKVRKGQGSGGIRPKSPRAVSAIARRSARRGAQAANGFADDERIPRPFVGVDRFGIGDEAADMIVEQNAVTAEEARQKTRTFVVPHGPRWS